jgi:hypothetical protein
VHFQSCKAIVQHKHFHLKYQWWALSTRWNGCHRRIITILPKQKISHGSSVWWQSCDFYWKSVQHELCEVLSIDLTTPKSLPVDVVTLQWDPIHFPWISYVEVWWCCSAALFFQILCLSISLAACICWQAIYVKLASSWRYGSQNPKDSNDDTSHFIVAMCLENDSHFCC